MNTSDNSKKTRTFLLAGNGFDIALGLKTKYSDFFMVIGLILALDIYDNSHITFDGKIPTYNFNDVIKKKKTITDKAIELLQGLNNTHSSRVISNSIEYIDDEKYEYYRKITEFALTWYISPDFDIDKFKKSVESCFFADFLGKIFNEIIPPLLGDVPQAFRFSKKQNVDEKLKEYILISHRAISADIDLALRHYQFFPRFIQILQKTIEKSDYQNWMDLESFIELLVTGNKYLESKFQIFIQEKNVNPYLFDKHALANDYSLGLEEFCLMFEKYISLITNEIPKNCNVNDIIEPYKKSFLERNTGEEIGLLDISNIETVINFNYTDTLSRLYPALNSAGKIYHINGKVSGDFASQREESQIVFGYTKNNKNIDVSPKCLIFEKDKQRFLKNIPMYNYNKVLGNDEFNIIIFGHSCSPADGDVFRSILNHPSLNKAVICCYNKDAMASTYENLVKILDENSSCDTTINDLIINKKVLFCLKEESHAEND